MEKNEYYKMYQFENDYWWYQGLHHLIHSFVDKHYKKNNQEPLTIFDAGCGTGRMMELLKDYGNTEGIDYAEEALELCKKRGVTNVKQGDLNQWQGKTEHYDIIISSDVLSNSGVNDDLAVVESFHRALKPGGLLLLNLPAFELIRREHDAAIFGKRRYRKYRFNRKLKERGFGIKRSSYRLPLLFFFLLLQKPFDKPVASHEAQSDLKPLSKGLNSTLLLMHRIENSLIRRGIPLLLGSSLFIAAQKPPA